MSGFGALNFMLWVVYGPNARNELLLLLIFPIDFLVTFCANSCGALGCELCGNRCLTALVRVSLHITATVSFIFHQSSILLFASLQKVQIKLPG
jgi:hypothetical protein